jgi:hypothetical protein
MWIVRGIAASCVALCAGCIDVPASAEATGSGVATGLQLQTLHCGSSATLDRYLAGGGGPVAISISDGAHQTIYADDTALNGQLSDSRQVDGVSGVWTLSVKPEGFAGQFKITLQCHAWFVGASEDPASVEPGE